MSKALGRLKQSEILRQKALDYIIANPGAIGPQIISHFQWNEASGGSRLLCMTEEFEIRREPVEYMVESKGHMRKQKTFAYFALVATTKRAEDVLATLGRNLTKAGREKHKKENPGTANQWVNGCWKNNPDSKAMYTNQGGQGASKPRMATYLEVMA